MFLKNNQFKKRIYKSGKQKKIWVIGTNIVKEGTPGAKKMSRSALNQRRNKIWILDNKRVPKEPQEPNKLLKAHGINVTIKYGYSITPSSLINVQVLNTSHCMHIKNDKKYSIF